jgi:PEP-CTERM motif
MKKNVVLFLAAFSTLSFLQSLKADTLAVWTFETSASTNNIVGAGDTPGATQSGVLADSGTGTASASHASSASAWSLPVGHGSAHSWSVNTWGVGDYFQFSVSTAGFQDINVSFEQISSGTGPDNFSLQYSTDGTSFTPFQDYNIVSGGNAGLNTWSNSVLGASETASEYSMDLSSVTALNDAPTVFFRLVDTSTTAANGNQVGTAGTDRVDDFTVFATAVPEPATLTLSALGGMACFFALRRRR